MIARGADEQLTSAEVKRRIDEAVCSEVDVRVRGFRPARGGGIVIDIPSDKDRKRLTTCPTFREIGLRVDEPKRIDRRIVIFDVPLTIIDEELMSNIHDKSIRNLKNKDDF